VILALAVGVSLSLAGCGGEDEETQPTAEATMTAAPEPTPQPAPTLEEQRPTGFLGQHGIYAAFPPADLELYRALLPPQFDMPDTPQVVVFVADYYDLNIPLSRQHPELGLPDMVPYLEGAVLLQCEYQGLPGQHVITMPVDDDTANKAGRLLGFPKYVADEITLEEANGGWVGRVMHEGRIVLGLEFTPVPGATAQTTTGGSYLRLFQLIPPGQGPEVSQVNSVAPTDTQLESVIGSASVQVDPDAEWAGLIPEGKVGAMFREATGASQLVPSSPE
jgi:hypothetical protein